MPNDEFNVRVPSTITVRDLIYIAIVIVSITTSFLLYGTRLSVMEQQLLTLGTNVTEIKQDMKEFIRDGRNEESTIKQSVRKLQDRQRDLESKFNRLEWFLNQEDEEG